jgi:plastocyanin
MTAVAYRVLASCFLLLVGMAAPAHAGTVTVNVTTQSGAAAADTVIVFDPLDAAPAPSHDAAIVDQINRRFVPRVIAVRTGTTITFPNSDRIRHQVYSFSPTRTFEVKLYAGAPQTPVNFDRPGLVVLGCNIHDNMVAFIAVVDSPYFATTGNSGAAVVNLPAGRYRPDAIGCASGIRTRLPPFPHGKLR